MTAVQANATAVALLSRLAGGVAPVAIGLSRGLTLDDPSNQVVGSITCFNLGLGLGFRVCCCLTLDSLGHDALLLLLALALLDLCSVALRATFVTRRRDR